MALPCLHSEHRTSEPDQSGYPHAALADVGRRNRQHRRDRAPARPHPTRDYPAAAALEELTGKAIFIHEGRRLFLTAEGETVLSYARSIVGFHDEMLSQLASPDIEGHVVLGTPRPLRRLHAARDPEDFPQGLSARSARAELLTLDAAGRLREARRSRYRAGHPHERFHRRTGGAAGAIDLDDRRAIQRA